MADDGDDYDEEEYDDEWYDDEDDYDEEFEKMMIELEKEIDDEIYG